MSARRFVIEGTWSGHEGRYGRVVHRQVYPAFLERLRAWAQATSAIHFTDGTALFLHVRDCEPRERVEEIRGYSTLIENCAWHGVASVKALLGLRDAGTLEAPNTLDPASRGKE